MNRKYFFKFKIDLDGDRFITVIATNYDSALQEAKAVMGTSIFWTYIIQTIEPIQPYFSPFVPKL